MNGSRSRHRVAPLSPTSRNGSHTRQPSWTTQWHRRPTRAGPRDHRCIAIPRPGLVCGLTHRRSRPGIPRASSRGTAAPRSSDSRLPSSTPTPGCTRTVSCVGDIHPRNILADRDDHVVLLDFALARRIGTDAAVPRAGVPFLLLSRSSHARCWTARIPRPHPRGRRTVRARRVTVPPVHGRAVSGFPARAALVSYGDLRCPCCRLPPAARAVAEAEAVLARALNRTPGGRYPSVAAFAAALRRSQPPARVPLPMRHPPVDGDLTHRPVYEPDDATHALGAFLARAGYGHGNALPPMPLAPTASVMQARPVSRTRSTVSR